MSSLILGMPEGHVYFPSVSSNLQPAQLSKKTAVKWKRLIARQMLQNFIGKDTLCFMLETSGYFSSLFLCGSRALRGTGRWGFPASGMEIAQW